MKLIAIALLALLCGCAETPRIASTDPRPCSEVTLSREKGPNYATVCDVRPVNKNLYREFSITQAYACR